MSPLATPSGLLSYLITKHCDICPLLSTPTVPFKLKSQQPSCKDNGLLMILDFSLQSLTLFSQINIPKRTSFLVLPFHCFPLSVIESEKPFKLSSHCPFYFSLPLFSSILTLPSHLAYLIVSNKSSFSPCVPLLCICSPSRRLLFLEPHSCMLRCCLCKIRLEGMVVLNMSTNPSLQEEGSLYFPSS